MNTSNLEERVNFLLRRIADRRVLAQEFRGQAIGASFDEAHSRLKTAEQAETYAAAVENALNILFDLNIKKEA